MKVYITTTLISLALMVCAAAAAHAQATINDCEKIQAADAYNQCLAKFGPPAKTLNIEGPRPGDVKSSSEEAAASGGKAGRKASGRRHHGRGKAVSRRGRGHAGRAWRGRKRMSISVGK